MKKVVLGAAIAALSTAAFAAQYTQEAGWQNLSWNNGYYVGGKLEGEQLIGEAQFGKNYANVEFKNKVQMSNVNAFFGAGYINYHAVNRSSSIPRWIQALAPREDMERGAYVAFGLTKDFVLTDKIKTTTMLEALRGIDQGGQFGNGLRASATFPFGERFGAKFGYEQLNGQDTGTNSRTTIGVTLDF